MMGGVSGRVRWAGQGACLGECTRLMFPVLPHPLADQGCHTWASSYTLNSQWQQLDQGEAHQSLVLLARLCDPQCLLPDGKEQL